MATNSSENSENRRERVGDRSSGSTNIVQGNFENLPQLGCADYGGNNGRDAHRTSDEIVTQRPVGRAEFSSAGFNLASEKLGWTCREDSCTILDLLMGQHIHVV